MSKVEYRITLGIASLIVFLIGAVLVYDGLSRLATPTPAPLQTIGDAKMAEIIKFRATLADLTCSEVRMLPLPEELTLTNGEVRLQTVCFRLGNLQTDQILEIIIERQVLVTYKNGGNKTYLYFTAEGTKAFLEIDREGGLRGELDASKLLEETGLATYLDEYTRRTKTLRFLLDQTTGEVTNIVLTDRSEY